MKKLWLVLLFIPLLLFSALAPPTIFYKANSLGEDKEKEKEMKFMGYLWREISPRFPVRILDVGTGMGTFIPKIRKLFESYGYTVTVDGLDNMSIFKKTQKDAQGMHVYKSVDDEAFVNTVGELRNAKIWLSDIGHAHNIIRHRYDFIFVNAPYPDEYTSDENFIDGSLKLLKDEGMLFIRFHWQTAAKERVDRTLKFIQSKNYSVIMANTGNALPAGYYPLHFEVTLIIKKVFFADPNDVVTGLSLGTIANQLLTMKAMEGSA